MRLVKKHLLNILLAGLVVFVISKQIPLLLHSNEQVGKNFFEVKAFNLSGHETLLPQEKKKKVYIFWATWCGPCHLQLAQFERAIKNKKLLPDQVVAISLDSSLEKVVEFQKQKNYSFKVFLASSEQSWMELGVQATPSIAFVDERNKIYDFFTGVSPLSVSKAKRFLKL